MQGIINMFEPKEAALMAVQAGNDVILCPLDIKNSITYLVQSVRNGTLNRNELDAHVLKILQAKEQLGLCDDRLIDIDRVDDVLQSHHAQDLKEILYQQAVTIVSDDGNLVPLDDASDIVVVDIGDSVYQDGYAQLHLSPDAGQAKCDEILDAIDPFETVVLRVFKVSNDQTFFGNMTQVDDVLQCFFDALRDSDKKVVTLLCMSPYALDLLPDYSTIVAYEKDCSAVDAAMDVLWGNYEATGVLPI